MEDAPGGHYPATDFLLGLWGGSGWRLPMVEFSLSFPTPTGSRRAGFSAQTTQEQVGAASAKILDSFLAGATAISAGFGWIRRIATSFMWPGLRSTARRTVARHSQRTRGRLVGTIITNSGSTRRVRVCPSKVTQAAKAAK